jgi:hypothetical protein
MVTSRYHIAFIYLLSVFLSLGIALYTAESETPSSPVIATAGAPELGGFSWNTGHELVTTYWVALNEVTQIIVTLPE